MAARSIICRLAVCLTLLPAAAAAQLDKIPWAKGPTRGVLGSEATINVPAGCLFTGMDGVKTFLEACPRCGATFLQGASCSECDIQPVPAGNPSA